jgi:6-phosphogluconate dehydrogenase
MTTQDCDYGMIGLGTMGRNLVYNMCDNGYKVAGFDKDFKKAGALVSDANGRKLTGATNLKEFFGALKSPRVILLLVPAGPVVDAVINELKPFLEKDDLIIDCGNSHFTDTDLRIAALSKEQINFMGVGISGGEYGALHGPSIMPGGPNHIYAQVAPMFEAISAKVNGEPCVTWLGPGSAGHYVKMVHNGIEYGLMQLISEAYHLLKVAGGMNNDELHEVFSKWNEGKLHSYLIEITAEIFAQKDDLSHNRLIDTILDSAKQNGTGSWTSEDAMQQQVPLTIIDTAVSMRDLSAGHEVRIAEHQKLDGPAAAYKGDKHELTLWLEDALYFSMITVYAQGMALLQAASRKYNYGLNAAGIARIWRGGCIIRASLLDDICAAFEKERNLLNMMTDDMLAEKLKQSQSGIRQVIKNCVETGVPMPAMMASLAYFDS